jgi:catechol 2,3-dioxygenase-like lactoylglutathione lyase family enzyme
MVHFSLIEIYPRKKYTTKFLREGALPGIWKCLLLSCAALPAAVVPAPCGHSQPATQAPALAGIAHVAIRVSDLPKARAFYEKLGFEEAFALDQSGTPTEAFLKVNDRQFIELYPQRQPGQQIGFMHVCFESTDLNSLHDFYIQRGLAPIAVRRAGAGNLLFTMEGPEKQNIEYTQYMPGSRHTNDRGQHLGPHRIAEKIHAAGLPMQDPAAARAFYTDKLAFTPAEAIEPGRIGLALPGTLDQQVEIVQQSAQSAFELFFSVSDLRQTAARLKELQIPAEKHHNTLSITDPDGNHIIFSREK